MDIKKVNSGICIGCGKPATKIIDGEFLCSDCSDTVLIKIISKCAKSLEQATATITIKPRGATIAEKVL